MNQRSIIANLFVLCGLAGCASEPIVLQDITLASDAPTTTSNVVGGRRPIAAPVLVDQPMTSSNVLTGSGASINVVSETMPSNRSIVSDTAQPVVAPELVPAPAAAKPTRLAKAMMIEPDNTTPEATRTVADKTQTVVAPEKKYASQIITLKRTKPNCKGSECPVITLKQLSFKDYPRFNSFVEQTLLSLALLETNNDQRFRNVAELEANFFSKARPRDEIALSSSLKYMSEEVVVVQLDSFIYTGGAHGISTTQYLNWLPKTDKLLTLEAMLLPGKAQAFNEALKKQHALWLKKNAIAKKDPAGYNKLWPFEPNDNVALLENGVAVTYDPYSIAPYSMGKPTIYIPFNELKGILQPDLLPKS